MRYRTIVEKNEDGLEEIIGAVQQFEEDRFLASLSVRRYTIYDIQQMAMTVREYQTLSTTTQGGPSIHCPRLLFIKFKVRMARSPCSSLFPVRSVPPSVRLSLCESPPPKTNFSSYSYLLFLNPCIIAVPYQGTLNLHTLLTLNS